VAKSGAGRDRASAAGQPWRGRSWSELPIPSASPEMPGDDATLASFAAVGSSSGAGGTLCCDGIYQAARRDGLSDAMLAPAENSAPTGWIQCASSSSRLSYLHREDSITAQRQWPVDGDCCGGTSPGQSARTTAQWQWTSAAGADRMLRMAHSCIRNATLRHADGGSL
jgi:hypothetical protein